MKHPIYKNADINRSRKYFLEKARKLGYEKAKEELVRQMVLHGAGNTEQLSKLVEAQLVGYIAEEGVANNGHILIKTEKDKWNAVQSRRTISMIRLENFKFPFKAGTILLDESEVSFCYENGLLNIVRHDTGGIHAITIISDITIGEAVEEIAPESDNMEALYAVLSILLYISAFNTKRYIEESIQPRCSGSNRKNVPKHVVNVVRLKQEVRSSGRESKEGSKTTKAWIVRGHWRNQYYSSTDEHKPKWMNPYWKGAGKEELEKTYKI